MECLYCHKKDNLKTCTGCNKAKYCSKECIRKDWKNHKTNCRKLEDSDFIILRPLKLYDYFTTKKPIPYEKDVIKNLYTPCPIIIVARGHPLIIWWNPTKPLIHKNSRFTCSDEQLKELPSKVDWLLNYQYLQEEERPIAIKKKLQWQDAFMIYDFSFSFGYQKIIDEFWNIFPDLQIYLNQFERYKKNNKEKCLAIADNLRDLKFKNPVNKGEHLVNMFIDNYVEYYIEDNL